ncbi:MAG: phosphomannomutase/phosphoglucomutase [Clostridia bacterium]|nr:phosphomannomutase/phosphoglucomutase [Clostridia bacterium]
MDIFKLQNGSDIRGVALDGVLGEDVNLNAEAVERIAGGFMRWLRARTPEGQTLRVAVGRDSRLSGPAISRTLCAALNRAGAEVADLGLATTPAMFMSTVLPRRPFDAAVMITASHLPWNRNGMKFFTAKGGAESADIREILTLAGEAFPEADVRGGKKRSRFMDTYAAFLRKKITDAAGRERPLSGLRIVVDAGNGAGGFFTKKVLEPLGADTTGSRYLRPDGHFPNHAPNPEAPEAMASIRDAVLESKADFGIIFDTDVDRAGAVLRSGEELNRNRLIAMISAILLREHPGTTIVTDSITSTGLAAFIRERGGVHHRFRRGYRNVINEAIRLNAEGTDCQIAMETSGHAALKENWFLDDGAYLIVRLLMELACGRDLESLIEGLPEPAESREFRLKITDPDFKTCGQTVLDALLRFARAQEGWTEAPDNHEGVRFGLDDAHGNGWFLLRLSLHDPVLPLNVESDSPGGVRVIAGELAAFLKTQGGIDVTPLSDYLRR